MEQNTNLATLDKFSIETRSGEVIKLDKKTVEQYLANGQEITNSEFTMFFQLCKVHKVNPFLKEAYLIKYGTSPATIVLDYKVLQQCAEVHPQYKGMKTGILVIDKDGNIKEKTGSYILPNETLIAGWCEVLRKDRDCPTKAYAMFDEFKQINKKTGELNSNWSGKPVFMITKVAKAQALREAFPNMFGSNVYTQEEATTFAQNEDYININPTEVKNKVTNDVATEEVQSFDDETGEVKEEPTTNYYQDSDLYD